MDLGDALVYIADKLGVTTQQLYQIYIAGQYAEAYANIICLGVLLTITFVAAVVAAIVARIKGEDPIEWAIGAGIIFALIGLVVAVGLYQTLLKLYAPKYMAAKTLIEDLSKLICAAKP